MSFIPLCRPEYAAMVYAMMMENMMTAFPASPTSIPKIFFNPTVNNIRPRQFAAAAPQRAVMDAIISTQRPMMPFDALSPSRP